MNTSTDMASSESLEWYGLVCGGKGSIVTRDRLWIRLAIVIWGLIDTAWRMVRA